MAKREMQKPVLEQICLAAENIILLVIQEGEVVGGVQVPYEPQVGESLEQDRDIPSLVYIVKDGKRIGVRVEDRQLGTRRFPFESVIGDRLDTVVADDPESYAVSGIHPLKVYRKSKANNMADPAGGYTFRHCIYLVFGEPFRSGAKIRLSLRPGLFDRDLAEWMFDPAHSFTEAIHVNQLGYRADDPSKKAYLSQWMGLGGGVGYDAIHQFYLLDERDSVVFRGDIRLNHKGEVVPVGREEISSLCPVYELDFSAFRGEGVFRVQIPELGCSFPFPIGEENTWLAGFRASMNALYCQRSGLVTGKPYSAFERPRCYHPEDGQVVYQSRCSLFQSGNGPNCFGTDTNNFGNLLRGATEEQVENAWGGYFDACDWDRRIQHLRASRMSIELFLMFPDFFRNMKLSIPESGNGLPDILNEALWNLAFYKRLQMPDGGIRGGIEQEEHPILGQCGWQDAWKAYAYAPDFWSSYYYAASAARMAFALKHFDQMRAKEYQQSAESAFRYAERTWPEAAAREGHKWTREAHEEIREHRERAACDLFRLTLDPAYEEIYLAVRRDSDYEADFVYATLPEGIGREPVRRACRQAILDAAEQSIINGNNLPYHLTSEDLSSDYAGGFGFFCTVPRNLQLIRAHFLTGEARYLAAAIAAEDFAAGANPDNLCFTTGVGTRWPKAILHHDSRMTGQPAPIGITICGPHDFHHPDDVQPRLMRENILWPGAYAWPSFESYLDIYRHPCMNEYTVQESLGPNAYQWGYLAARMKGSK